MYKILLNRNKIFKIDIENKMQKVIDFFLSLKSLQYTGVVTNAPGMNNTQSGILGDTPSKLKQFRRASSGFGEFIPISRSNTKEISLPSANRPSSAAPATTRPTSAMGARPATPSSAVFGSSLKDNRMSQGPTDVAAVASFHAPYPIAHTHFFLFSHLLGIYPQVNDTVKPVLGYIATIVLTVATCDRYLYYCTTIYYLKS
jgi:hypothetical protein